MLATMAMAQKLATRSEPKPRNRAAAPERGQHAHGKDHCTRTSTAARLRDGLRSDDARRKQRERDQRLKPGHRRREPAAAAGRLASRLHLRLSCGQLTKERDEMAGGISIHAVDVASGRPAQGLRVEIWRIEPRRTCVAEGRLEPNGVLDHPVSQGVGNRGRRIRGAVSYRRIFRRAATAFSPSAPFRFRIAEVDQHFHLPLKFTRWGYSLFRGA